MADKGKEGKEGEGYEFVPPDFDEDQFIHKEMVSFKTTLILFCWGIVAALLSWLAFSQISVIKTGWFAGLAICAAAFLALRPIFKAFKADIKHWGRREWVGTAFLFFFTWLGIFIVAINPPLSDFAAPRIDVVVSPPAQQAGGIVNVDVFYEDNDNIKDFSFRLSKDGITHASDADLVYLGHGHYRYQQALPTGIYAISATAQDDRGNAAATETTFAVIDVGLRVFLPAGNTLDDISQVFVKVENQNLPACVAKKGRVINSPCIRTVHLDTTAGNRVWMRYEADNDRWAASANYAGWSQGQTTFTATAEIIGQWVGTTFIHGGNLTSDAYTVNVTGTIGSFAPPVIAEPRATARSVPSLEFGLVAVGLVALAIVARRR